MYSTAEYPRQGGRFLFADDMSLAVCVMVCGTLWVADTGYN